MLSEIAAQLAFERHRTAIDPPVDKMPLATSPRPLPPEEST
jgi:hypothetical protein